MEALTHSWCDCCVYVRVWLLQLSWDGVKDKWPNSSASVLWEGRLSESDFLESVSNKSTVWTWADSNTRKWGFVSGTTSGGSFHAISIQTHKFVISLWKLIFLPYIDTYIHRVRKKRVSSISGITSSNLGRFSKLFHNHNVLKICKKSDH